MAEAEEDLAAARDMTEIGRFKWAVFAARQAVEQALKGAYQAAKRLEAPHVHGLRQLARETFEEVPDEVSDLLRSLDPLYTISRYPSVLASRPSEQYTEDDARDYVRAAAEVISWISERLSEMS